MADDAKARLDKIGKLVVVFGDLHEKQQAVIDEIVELAGGGAGIGAKLKEFQAAWQEAWNMRYQGTYAWAWVKDVPQQKRLLKAFTLEDLRGRIGRFIRDEDQFLVRNRHAFGLFVSGVNKFTEERPVGGMGLLAGGERPIGCSHTPACPSDTACTKKRMAAARGIAS